MEFHSTGRYAPRILSAIALAWFLLTDFITNSSWRGVRVSGKQCLCWFLQGHRGLQVPMEALDWCVACWHAWASCDGGSRKALLGRPYWEGLTALSKPGMGALVVLVSAPWGTPRRVLADGPVLPPAVVQAGKRVSCSPANPHVTFKSFCKTE